MTIQNNAVVGLVITCLSAVLFATVVTAAPVAAQGAPQISACSVASAEGGIDVTWTPLDIAVDYYVYRVETDGNPDRYGQSQTSNAFVAVQGTASIFVGAFISGVGYTPAIDCGTTTAGPGGPNNDPQCSVATAGGGVRASWDVIAGAVEYVWRLEVAGQPNRYNRVTEPSALIPVSQGVTATVFVSGVLANGSYTAGIACGSATGGTGNPTTGPTCSVASADGGVQATWSAIAGAVRYVYRYNLSTAPGVNRYNQATGLGDLIKADQGVAVTVFVSGQRANGSYTGAIPCGTATAGDGGGTDGPNCVVEFFPNATTTAILRWDDLPGAERYSVVAGAFSLFETTQTFNEVMWEVIPWSLPTRANITISFNNGPNETWPCEITSSVPAPTLGAPNAACNIVFDQDLQDATFNVVPSGSNVASYVYYETAGFNGRGTVRVEVTGDFVRAPAIFQGIAAYQEVIDGQATEIIRNCPSSVG